MKIIMNELKTDFVISSLRHIECFKPYYWKQVSKQFGNEFFQEVENNKKITSVVSEFFWFPTVEGCTIPIGKYKIYFVVEDGITTELSITYKNKKYISWTLK